MAKGKKTPPEVIYKVMSLYAVEGSTSEVGRQLSMPESTVRELVIKNKDKEEFVKLCAEKKADFAERASTIIDKGLMLLNRRMAVALDRQDELDKLMDEVCESELSERKKQRAISTLRTLELQDIRAITTAIGTLYDKRALAKGEATSNTKVTIDLPEGMSEYAD